MSRVDDMPGFLAALLAAAAMFLTAFFAAPEAAPAAPGICEAAAHIPAPVPLLGCALGYAVLWLVASLSSGLNRQYNVEEGTSALPATFFVVGTAALPAVGQGLSTALLLPLGAIIALRLMFACHERETSARELFLVASTLSFGSMLSYAFIPLAFAAAVAAATLREFDIRSIPAFIFGLAAPYAIVIAFGIVDPSEISLPEIYAAAPPAWPYVASAAITALTALMLLMRQAVGPSARSSKALALNRAINILLIIMIAAMAADFNHIIDYLPAVMLLAGFPIAGMAADRNATSPTVIVFFLALAYITLFFFAL